MVAKGYDVVSGGEASALGVSTNGRRSGLKWMILIYGLLTKPMLNFLEKVLADIICLNSSLTLLCGGETGILKWLTSRKGHIERYLVDASPSTLQTWF